VGADARVGEMDGRGIRQPPGGVAAGAEIPRPGEAHPDHRLARPAPGGAGDPVIAGAGPVDANRGRQIRRHLERGLDPGPPGGEALLHLLAAVDQGQGALGLEARHQRERAEPLDVAELEADRVGGVGLESPTRAVYETSP
jgi:hypothetical protein